jgi:hypothetical protein
MKPGKNVTNWVQLYAISERFKTLSLSEQLLLRNGCWPGSTEPEPNLSRIWPEHEQVVNRHIFVTFA